MYCDVLRLIAPPPHPSNALGEVPPLLPPSLRPPQCLWWRTHHGQAPSLAHSFCERPPLSDCRRAGARPQVVRALRA